MEVYYVVILIMLLLQIKVMKKSKNLFRFYIAMSILLLVSSLRGNGNGDYFVYLSYSKYINTTKELFDSSFPMEFGFRLISFLVNSFKMNEQWVIAVMNIISLICITIFIKRYSNDRLFSVILFLPIFFMFDMHAARTAVAISISSLGFKYLLDSKFLKYILVIFIASLFHKIALILIVLPFLIKIKFNEKFYFVSIFASILFVKLFSVNVLLYKLLNVIGLYGIAVRFNLYSNDMTYGYAFSLIDPRLILCFLVFVFSILISKFTKVGYEGQILVKLNWFLIIIMILFSSNTIFVIRVYGFLNIFSIIQIPYFLKHYRLITGFNSYFVVKNIMILTYVVYLIGMLQNYPEYIFFFN